MKWYIKATTWTSQWLCKSSWRSWFLFFSVLMKVFVCFSASSLCTAGVLRVEQPAFVSGAHSLAQHQGPTIRRLPHPHAVPPSAAPHSFHPHWTRSESVACKQLLPFHPGIVAYFVFALTSRWNAVLSTGSASAVQALHQSSAAAHCTHGNQTPGKSPRLSG